MENECNNNFDPSWQKAIEKIRHDSKKCKPTCCVGPTGPTGPSGPTSTDTLAVAQLTKTTAQTISTVGTFVSFNTSTAFKNSTVSTTGITVNNAGTYQINFGFNATAGTGSALSIYKNGVEVGASRLTLIDEAGSAAGSIIITLANSDTIGLASSLLTTNIVLPASQLNAYITIIPIYIS